MAYILSPPPLVMLWVTGNGAVAIWWGVNMLVTRRPW